MEVKRLVGSRNRRTLSTVRGHGINRKPPNLGYLTLHRNQSRASLKGNGVVSGLVDNWKTPQSGHDCRGGSRAKRPELSAETTVAAGNMLIALGGALGVLPGYLVVRETFAIPDDGVPAVIPVSPFRRFIAVTAASAIGLVRGDATTRRAKLGAATEII